MISFNPDEKPTAPSSSGPPPPPPPDEQPLVDASYGYRFVHLFKIYRFIYVIISKIQFLNNLSKLKCINTDRSKRDRL